VQTSGEGAIQEMAQTGGEGCGEGKAKRLVFTMRRFCGHNQFPEIVGHA
jgi:hypothetical protein